ncbi:hypothetical protein CIRG_05408 [Coccidioides immitis RMSCC 2394]|uniref:Predicted protein n=3 Tax=Coccidioides TaxID=5500 RepID=E9D7H9_COCPS|nr:predicted protein [Coccidioides posadasii str. Silveira]KMM71019.1 hypothetical protein CPAG_07326 [Coccidioides posadasii RMSCC 3488]KMP05727.1 hypothetical protein CIRG_05408 [Coccidioides immitis RMSCC 2394]
MTVDLIQGIKDAAMSRFDPPEWGYPAVTIPTTVVPGGGRAKWAAELPKRNGPHPTRTGSIGENRPCGGKKSFKDTKYASRARGPHPRRKLKEVGFELRHGGLLGFGGISAEHSVSPHETPPK